MNLLSGDLGRQSCLVLLAINFCRGGGGSLAPDFRYLFELSVKIHVKSATIRRKNEGRKRTHCLHCFTNDRRPLCVSISIIPLLSCDVVYCFIRCQLNVTSCWLTCTCIVPCRFITVFDFTFWFPWLQGKARDSRQEVAGRGGSW